MGARVHGINPVLEALKAGRVSAVRVGARSDPRLQHVVRVAESAGVPVRRVDPDELESLARGAAHQGVVADVRAARDYSVEDLVRGAAGAPLLVVLDGIEDPHNVGAIVRSVDACGAHGVIRQTRRSASLDSAAVKASAGALMHVPVADVVNVARAVEELKGLGVWTVGLAGDAAQPYDTVDLALPTAIVLGAEGSGLRRLVRERCDLVVSIPMRGHVDSLNVSVAAGVMLFEAMRQRRQAGAAARDR
jgi:23S rRNA (guanosine2251-2'-O)-methyltransferase